MKTSNLAFVTSLSILALTACVDADVTVNATSTPEAVADDSSVESDTVSDDQGTSDIGSNQDAGSNDVGSNDSGSNNPGPYAFSGGAGTSGSPYVLSTPADVTHIGDFPAAYYSLNADIEMAGVAFSPLPAFSGTLYGNNHILYHLTVTNSSVAKAAMFVSVSGTVVSLRLLNMSVSGQNYAAGLAGHLTGMLSNCGVYGTITSTSGGNGYNTGTGNPFYVTKGIAGTVPGAAMDVQFNGNRVTSIQ